MKIEGGYYIKARKIQESEIMKKPPYMRDIWDYLMREANHKTKTIYGRTIKRGQLFRNFTNIIKDLSWNVGYRKETYSKWQCEKTMKYLRQRGMILTTRTTRGLLITICNYEFYQNPKNYESNSKQTTKATREQLTPDSINKNGLKNEKKKKKDIYLDYVFLTKIEYEKLVKKFGQEVTNMWIRKLNDYIGSTGRKYNSHYYTIRVWYNKEKGNHKKLSEEDL